MAGVTLKWLYFTTVVQIDRRWRPWSKVYVEMATITAMEVVRDDQRGDHTVIHTHNGTTFRIKDTPEEIFDQIARSFERRVGHGWDG